MLRLCSKQKDLSVTMCGVCFCIETDFILKVEDCSHTSSLKCFLIRAECPKLKL